MTAFYVGQRVKLVRDCLPENLGSEGTVIGFSFYPKGTLFRDGDIRPYDCDFEIVHDDEGFKRADSMHRYEPIQSSGNQIHEILAWKNCPDRDCKIARVGERANA